MRIKKMGHQSYISTPCLYLCIQYCCVVMLLLLLSAISCTRTQRVKSYRNFSGDESWRYSNMLEFFKKSETYLGEFPSDQHGDSGPITVSVQKYAPGREEWLEAGRELGYEIADSNGPQKISFAPIEFAKQNGRRVSSYVGYIKPIMGTRRNLKCVLHGVVSKVMLAGTKAIGIQYSVNNTAARLAFARKEVILSAGAYGSATLLMRSGIGPAEVLRNAMIPQIKELPVGENFQDHPIVPLFFILGNKSLAFDPETDLTPENYELFEKYGEGPYTTESGFAGQAFIASSVARAEGFPDWPDMDIALTSYSARLPLFKNLSLAPHETTVWIKPYFGRCKSRGTVKLDPRNVNGMRLIDFNYIDNPLDEQIFLEMINQTLKIFETKAYQKVGARYPTELVKGCENIEFRSEEYWKCYMRQAMIGGNHPTSTCSMNSVVDSKLRVIGIHGLRIVDGSIFPYITNSNLHAAIYGIAEKASHTILQDWL